MIKQTAELEILPGYEPLPDSEQPPIEKPAPNRGRGGASAGRGGQNAGRGNAGRSQGAGRGNAGSTSKPRSAKPPRRHDNG